MNMMQAALEFRKAIEYLVQKIDVDTELEKLLEIPSFFLHTP